MRTTKTFTSRYSDPSLFVFGGAEVLVLYDHAIGFVLRPWSATRSMRTLAARERLSRWMASDGRLTARHVIEPLPDRSRNVVLVLAGSMAQLHKILVNMDHCQRGVRLQGHPPVVVYFLLLKRNGDRLHVADQTSIRSGLLQLQDTDTAAGNREDPPVTDEEACT